MPKERTLKAALDRYKNRDYKQEKQHRSEKEAAKKKQRKAETKAQNEALDEVGGVTLEAVDREVKRQLPEQGDGGLSSESDLDQDEDKEAFDLSGLNESASESDDEDGVELERPISSKARSNGTMKASVAPTINGAGQEGEDDVADDDDSIALSDMEQTSDTEDIVPHQRLTINNTIALNHALDSISLPYSDLTFSEHQSITTSEPVPIPDVNDDLNRELAFYAQSLSAVQSARKKLNAEGVPFTRPTDYFAEMVKSDEHMGKIKSKLMDDAASKKASAEARRQRDLKKFGKQVQHEKLQERAKSKREMLDKVKILKRKRAQGGTEGDKEADLFDVVLDDAAETDNKDKGSRKRGTPGGEPGAKRQKKNEKFGFGGKKRGAKRGDAASAGDMSGFSTKKMKGQAATKGGKKRPGKSKREKMR